MSLPASFGIVALLSGWPLVEALAPRTAGFGAKLATTAGLTALVQALGLFWIGLAGPGSISRTGLILIHGTLAGAGLLLLKRRGRAAETVGTVEPRPAWEPAADLAWLGLGTLAVLWAWGSPFTEWDTFAIWGFKATRLFHAGGFDGALYPDDVFDPYQAYPPLVPFLYAVGWEWTGRVHEGAALASGAVLGVATLAAVRALGNRVGSRGAGALAAACLALSPMVSGHLASGYADLPHALYVVLAAYWLAELAVLPRTGTAILAAASLAGAAWSKPTGLVVLGLAGAAAAALWIRDRRGGAWAAAAVAGSVLLAAPWYLRTRLVCGAFIPVQWWADLARHDPVDLLPFFQHRQELGLAAACLAMAGQIRAVGGAARAGAGAVLLLGYIAVWWWKLSYDARLLMPAIALAAGIGTGAVLAVCSALRLSSVAAVGLLVWAVFQWPMTVYPQQAAHLLSGTAMPRERQDAGTDVARALRIEAVRGPVDLITTDGRLIYHLGGDRRVRLAAGLPYRLDHVRGATHLALGPWTDWAASVHHLDFPRTELGRALRDGRRFRLLLSVEGFRLYRIRGVAGVRRPMRF